MLAGWSCGVLASCSLARVIRVVSSSSMSAKVSYVGQKVAQDIDNTLFNEYKYSVDQLMEIAGLCCAQVLATCYKVTDCQSVLIACGPGNNGGDGLAAARHLLSFGYRPEIFYPKRTDKPVLQILAHQCSSLGIPFVDELPLPSVLDGRYNVVLDAIFGFSFKGNVRPPFDRALDILKQCKIPICSVDVPSGWDVEEGNVDSVGVEPEVLISLTCPKICAKQFRGRHFLGLRIIPEGLAKKYDITLPVYSGTDQIVEIRT